MYAQAAGPAAGRTAHIKAMTSFYMCRATHKTETAKVRVQHTQEQVPHSLKLAVMLARHDCRMLLLALMACRNVTVRGPFNVTAANRPVLDSNFLFAPGEICSSCIFTLRDLVLKHDRKGSGPQIDWLTGYSLCSFYLFIQTSKLGYCRQTIVHGVSGKFSNIAD